LRRDKAIAEGGEHLRRHIYVYIYHVCKYINVYAYICNFFFQHSSYYTVDVLRWDDVIAEGGKHLRYCMYVCKDSAAPAHARTRTHRPAASRQSPGVSQTPDPMETRKLVMDALEREMSLFQQDALVRETFLFASRRTETG